MSGAFTKQIVAIKPLFGANRNPMNNGYFRRGVSQDTQRLLQHGGANQKAIGVSRSTLS
jgi:hypothetical protein